MMVVRIEGIIIGLFVCVGKKEEEEEEEGKDDIIVPRRRRWRCSTSPRPRRGCRR